MTTQGDSSSSNDEEDYVLVAAMDNAKNLSAILKSISFKESATCFVSSNGIKMTVEQSKCLQANAFVQASLFREFSFNSSGPVAFQISLSTLIECLNIFGGGSSGSGLNSSHTSLKLCYGGYGHPLSLVLEEGGVVTECSLQTEETSETLDFDFASTNVLNRLIMQAECLRDAFSELDTSSEVVEMHLSPSSPHFRLSTRGYSGTTQIDYPKDSEMMELFECQTTLINKYKLLLLKPCTKALSHSSKVSLRMDHRGFLSLQCMLLTEDKETCFVEFLCVPEEDIAE